MKPLEVAQRYFDAWNRRDPAGIVATFAEGGTYSDPIAGQELRGQAIAEYARGLFTAYPDLSFEIISVAPTGEGRVVVQWLMRGTNTGPYGGRPPTGRSVVLPGADFISVEGDKIRAVQGYFDTRVIPEQLGFQVIVQPYSIGPVTFGAAVHMQLGRFTRPGAFSITSMSVRSDEEREEVRQRVQGILQEMARMPGFISAVLSYAGNRMFTTTAWEDAESPKQALRSRAHSEAMDRFFGPDFAAGLMTSVWVPDRINALWVRCPSCGRVMDYEKLAGNCQCGQPLPEMPYW